MIHMVIFDMAGTTVNEQNVVYKTLRAAIQEAGAQVSQEIVNQVGAGKEKRQAIVDILQHIGADQLLPQATEIHQSFLKQLSGAYETLDVKPISGAENIFDYLQKNDIKVVLNTGYDRPTAEGLIEKLNWKTGSTIHAMVTASEVSRSRPHPDMITHAQQLMNVQDPATILKIGDSAVDIEEGKNAGCGITVGITTGAQTREMLATANPNYIIDDLRELVGIISLANEDED